MVKRGDQIPNDVARLAGARSLTGRKPVTSIDTESDDTVAVTKPPNV
jgi:hypothetical protein